MFSWCTTFCTSMIGLAPETVTVSSTIVASTLAENPVSISMPSRMNVLKPGRTNVTV